MRSSLMQECRSLEARTANLCIPIMLRQFLRFQGRLWRQFRLLSLSLCYSSQMCSIFSEHLRVMRTAMKHVRICSLMSPGSSSLLSLTGKLFISMVADSGRFRHLVPALWLMCEAIEAQSYVSAASYFFLCCDKCCGCARSSSSAVSVPKRTEWRRLSVLLVHFLKSVILLYHCQKVEHLS